MSRKKFITYLLIILTLVMIVDIRYVRSDNNLFEGLITESIQKMIKDEKISFNIIIIKKVSRPKKMGV